MVTDAGWRGADPRRGAALFVVLLFAAFLAGLAATALRTGLSGARAAAVFADSIRADALGRGAADALAYRLATGDAEAKRGGAIGLRLPGADVTVDYLSESARVDANAAPVPLVAALLAASGAEGAEAEAVAARITRFRADAAARAKAAQPAGGDAAPPPGSLAAINAAVDAMGPASKTKPPVGPAAIRDLAEVATAWGLSDALARRVLPSLTVSSGEATVDPVLAARPILLALLGGDERADDYIQRRQAGFVDKDSALALLPVPSKDFVAFTDSPAVRAVARVRVANRFERRYEFVLAPGAETPSGAAPPAPGSPPAPGAPPAPGLPPAPGGAGASDGAAKALVVVSWRRLP